jgi:protein ImuA
MQGKHMASDFPSPAGLVRRSRLVDELRVLIGKVAAKPTQAGGPGCLAFGWPPIDAALPGQGLALGALHEVADGGSDLAYGAAAALFIGGILARLPGSVLWVVERQDLFAPALAGVGVDASRVIYAEARTSAAVLLAMEEGLRHVGLAGVVGEITGRLTLTASRRLQLAAEASGVSAFALRRSHRPQDRQMAEPNAAVTRWRIAMLPSAPALPRAPDVPGLGRARWRVDLVRCRGGEPGSWIVEACDATGHIGLAAEFSDRSVVAEPGLRAAG